MHEGGTGEGQALPQCQGSLCQVRLAGRTDPPTWTALNLRGVNAEQPQALRAAAERVAVNDVCAWAVDHALFVAVALNVRNGWKADAFYGAFSSAVDGSAGKG